MNNKIMIELIKAFCFRITLVGAATLVLSFYGFSQTPGRGFVPGGGFATSDFESVNLTNGNLNMSFPIAQLPVGRGGLTAGYYLTYNSKLYDITTEYLENQI